MVKSAGPSLIDALDQARGASADEIAMAFVEAVLGRGLELYPAQEQAILEIMSDRHVILSTPTGSGKSLVAFAMVFRALAEGRRVFYTAPIKALVSEKFFQLCDEVGAAHVGMMTGDASVNRDAPVICCTAEILANVSLLPPDSFELHYVVMDEFHYYGDRDRGSAWQLPLIARPDVQYLLMSATLGDTSTIQLSLENLSSREVVRVHSRERPVPLEFRYVETPLHETLAELLRENRTPIYLVNFTQREAAENIQSATSIDVADRDRKNEIASTLKNFRFDSPYGRDVQRYLRHGLGLHHAGLLPKYRRVVEQLAQRGLLKIVSGTDTLGVGINIPIRTVLFTKLFKFDGEKLGIVSVRDFQQIAGRAGRKGFDDAGTVVCEAPEHVIENRKIAIKIAANPQKKKKLVKKKPPERNFINWSEKTFTELATREPERLESRFAITHAMLLQTLRAYPGTTGYRRVIELIGKCHDDESRKTHHRRYCRTIFKSLLEAKVVRVLKSEARERELAISEDLQDDFSMDHTLSLFLMEALELLDPSQDDYALDVVSLVEAILEQPRVILKKQVDKRKGELLAELKAAGVEYEERLQELDKVEHEKPRAEFIYSAFNDFAARHPWIASENIRPKSVARDLYERCMSFREYVKEYGLQRSEGLVLRYLSDVYRTLTQSVPEQFRNERVTELEVYLQAVVNVVDNSLIQEWEALANPEDLGSEEYPLTSRSLDLRRDKKRFVARIRAEMHQAVRALAHHDIELAAAQFRRDEDAVDELEEAIGSAMAEFFSHYRALDCGPRARQSDKTTVRELDDGRWQVAHVLVDDQDDFTWAIHGEVNLDEDFSPQMPMVDFHRIGP